MNIRNVIKRHGWKTQDVAAELGITVSSLQQRLGGNPTVKTLHEIAFVIGADVAEFFDDEREKQPQLTCPKCGCSLRLVEA